MRRLLALLPLALIAALAPASAPAAEVGVHSENMSYVKNIPYPAKNGGTPNFGTDIEFASSPVASTRSRAPTRTACRSSTSRTPRRRRPSRPTTAASPREDEQVMTIAYYNGGVHVVDISGLMGISLGSTQVGGAGMREIGSYRTDGSDGAGPADTWSAKIPRIDANGDFYLYGNDIARGLDVYKFSASATPSARRGRWMTPAQAATFLSARPRVGLSRDTAFFCLLQPPQ